jgi:hypothetical protein
MTIAAQRIIDYARQNDGFLSMAEARKNNAAILELTENNMLLHASREGIDGYKLSAKGAKHARDTAPLEFQHEPITAIEYQKTAGKWHPHSVETAHNTFDFDFSKVHGLLYHCSGSGVSKEHLLHGFTKPKALPGKLWVAPGVKVVYYKSDATMDDATMDLETLPASPAKIKAMGYQLLDAPLMLEKGPNPFDNAEEGETVWCGVCKDFLLREDDVPCDHLEFCERCGNFVYSKGHVSIDDEKGPKGTPIVHSENGKDEDD